MTQVICHHYLGKKKFSTTYSCLFNTLVDYVNSILYLLNCSLDLKKSHFYFKPFLAVFLIFWLFSSRICWHSWLPESRGAEKRTLRKSCWHLGMRSYSLYFTGGLPTLLGWGPTQALCSDQSWRIRCKFLAIFERKLCC